MHYSSAHFDFIVVAVVASAISVSVAFSLAFVKQKK